MRSWWKMLLAVVLAGAVVAVIVLWRVMPATENSPPGAGVADGSSQAYKPLPCLVEFSAGDCGPCKLMEPILNELARDYEGRLRIETVDLWKRPTVAEENNIRMYPTQIFYDAMGNELFRHEGFFSRQDILEQWKRLGHDFEQP
jgi:thioredoxin 1